MELRRIWSGLFPKGKDSRLQATQRLLQERGLDPTDHAILQQNLAQNLEQLSPATFRKLASSGFALEDVPVDSADRRPLDKLRRDLDKPYTDAQVEERLHSLQEKLQDTLRDYVTRNHGEYPSQMWVVGSLVKGRFGANSDVDVVFSEAPADYAPLSNQDEVQSIYLDPDRRESPAEQLAFYGPKVSLQPQAVLEGRQTLEQLHRTARKGP